MDRRAQGAEQEDRVAQYLLSEGYTLVTRRFRVKGGEVDIIAMDGDTLVFVEVKFRRRGAPEEALGHTKAGRFDDAVTEFLGRTGAHRMPVRYDLIAVTPDGLRHHKGAFHR